MKPGFSPYEVGVVREGIERLESQTRGQIRIEVGAVGDCRIERLGPADMRTILLDAKSSAPIYGAYAYESKTLDLVPDRIPSRREFVHVVMHEFLHAAGVVEHTAGKDDVLSAVVLPRPTLEMTDGDWAGLCRFVGCVEAARPAR